MKVKGTFHTTTRSSARGILRDLATQPTGAQRRSDALRAPALVATAQRAHRLAGARQRARAAGCAVLALGLPVAGRGAYEDLCFPRVVGADLSHEALGIAVVTAQTSSG